MIKIFAIWNIIVFLVMGYDKSQSRKRGQRVPEKILLVMALLGGGMESFSGSRFFHHKTQKTAFKILLPVGFIIAVVLMFYLLKDIVPAAN